MHLPIQAQATTLSAEQAKVLDDEFFRANPLSHFASRATMLLEASRSTYRATPTNEPEFFDALGLVDAETALEFDGQQRSTQVAVDALSLRHQAAEALARFIYARVVATPAPGDAPCTWLAIADSPTNIIDVTKANTKALEETPNLFGRLLFPAGTVLDAPAANAGNTAIAWANYATWLLTNIEIPINAAHNKLKHGLATSVRNDLRIEWITTPPNADGNLPLSAFGEDRSLPLFDRPMLTYLSRPPRRLKQGLELTHLRVDLPTVLTETWMIANIYAAMFHIAAREHYGEARHDNIAPYPKLAAGRLPEHVIGYRPLGYRTAVTLPPDGATAPRPSGLAFYGHFLPIKIDFDSKSQGVVVDG